MIGFFCVSVTLFDIDFPAFKYFSFAFFFPAKCFPFVLWMTNLSLSSTNSLGFLQIPKLKFRGGKGKTVPYEVFNWKQTTPNGRYFHFPIYTTGICSEFPSATSSWRGGGKKLRSALVC